MLVSPAWFGGKRVWGPAVSAMDGGCGRRAGGGSRVLSSLRAARSSGANPVQPVPQVVAGREDELTSLCALSQQTQVHEGEKIRPGCLIHRTVTPLVALYRVGMLRVGDRMREKRDLARVEFSERVGLASELAFQSA